jgi:K+-transporting ATPase KdpF subunit
VLGADAARALIAGWEQAMTWIYVLGAAVALALFAYLVCALLRPEKFQ